MKAIIYLHGDKESNYEQGKALGLEGEALNDFTFTCYEVKVECDVDQDGTTKIVRIDGREVTA